MPSPPEEDRYHINSDQIETHFKVLEKAEIGSISPHLILNVDETGFGASKSERAKSRKVIVPARSEVIPVDKETQKSHFITSLCAIPAAGDVCRRGIITKKETDHPDAEFLNFSAHVRRSSMLKFHVTARIFEGHLTSGALPDITE
jgi:hypothetical protein